MKNLKQNYSKNLNDVAYYAAICGALSTFGFKKNLTLFSVIAAGCYGTAIAAFIGSCIMEKFEKNYL